MGGGDVWQARFIGFAEVGKVAATQRKAGVKGAGQTWRANPGTKKPPKNGE
jgi:hypothetical protein